MSKLLRYPFSIATLLLVFSLAWAFFVYGQSIEAAQGMVRFTARISLAVFTFVFTASALHRFFRGEFTAELLRNRRRLGLSFAYAHTVHLTAIIIFFLLAHITPTIVAVITGGIAYLLMYAMALTSNDASVKKLGAKNWKRLHKIGIYYLWFIFFATYLRRLLPGVGTGAKPGGTTTEFAIGLILILAIFAFRIAAAVLPKTRQAKSEAVS